MKASLSRILVGLLATAGLVGASVNAQAAGTASSNFTVTMNLTAACQITFPNNDTNVVLSYTAFSSSAVTGEKPFTVQCSQGLPYTPSLAVTTGTLVGVDYTLDLLSGSSGTTAAGATTAGATAETFRVRASAAAGQAGTCSTGTCSATSAPYTLTVTY